MLFEPLDHVIGTRNKVRLLRALTPLDRPVSGREAARLAGVSHYAIGALDELAAVGLVCRQEAAGQNLYRFDRRSRLAAQVEALFEGERQRNTALWHRLAALAERAGRVESAAVFGSAARGDAKPGSDFDVIVLTEGAPEPVYDAFLAAAPELATEFGIRISPVVLSVVQARRQHADGDAFIADAMRDARRFHGRPLEEVLRG